MEPFNFASFLGVLEIGFLEAIARNGVWIQFFYLLFAFLNFQLLPRPPLSGYRGGARLRVSGRGSGVSTRLSCDWVFCLTIAKLRSLY